MSTLHAPPYAEAVDVGNYNANIELDRLLRSGDRIELHSFIAGRAVRNGERLPVHNPWHGSIAGSVTRIGRAQLDERH